jgi:ABC-type multidrug transport system ATPase subunit
VGRTAQVALLSQELGDLDGGRRVLDSVEEIRRVIRVDRDREVSASSMLERFGFTGDRLTARIGDLSGGERRRLQLLRLLLHEPNVLLLDEPTNDLDIDTLTVVEDYLDGWPGTLVVVSHDRYFLERICDTIWALPGDGSLVMLPGGVEQYLARRAAVRQSPSAADAAAGASLATHQAPKQDAAAQRSARKELARLERQLAKVSARIAEVHEEMAAAASDYVRLGDLDVELAALCAEHDALETAWLETADQAAV